MYFVDLSLKLHLKIYCLERVNNTPTIIIYQLIEYYLIIDYSTFLTLRIFVFNYKRPKTIATLNTKNTKLVTNNNVDHNSFFFRRFHFFFTF